MFRRLRARGPGKYPLTHVNLITKLFIRLRGIEQRPELNDGNMKDVSRKIIDNVSAITNEQKKQVSNCQPNNPLT